MVARRPRLAAAAWLLLAVVAIGCAPRDRSLLPPTVGDWAAGDCVEFIGDELFEYIDGGAEIYHEHGFDRVAVCDYSRGDERISVELYTMSGSAFGIYSYARSHSGQAVDIGTGGTLAEYYLHIWAGQHLVAVTCQTDSSDARAAVLEIGRGVAERLSGVGDVPQLLDLLPVERCRRGTETYFVGPIGCYSAAPRVAELFHDFDQGVAQRCDAPGDTVNRLVVLLWSDPQGAAQAVEEAIDAASAEAGWSCDPAGDDRVTFRSDGDDVVVAARAGAVVRIVLASSSVPDLETLFFTDAAEVSDELE